MHSTLAQFQWPDELQRLLLGNKDSLQVLVLRDGHEVRELASVLYDMTALRRLDFARIRTSTPLIMADVPTSSPLRQNMRRVTFEDMQLTDMPPQLLQFENLNRLSLAGNELESLPDAITELTELLTLNLEHVSF